jgi:hypothetical protein
MAQNEGLGDKILRYGTAILIGGGLFGLGKEALADIRRREYQDLVEPINEAFYEQENYKKAYSIANSLLEKEDMEVGILRYALYMKALSCYYMADNKELYNQAKNLYFEYGNKYGWEEEIIYMVMRIDAALDNVLDTRNEAIILMNSDNSDFRKEATELYNITTDNILEYSFSDSISYSERKYIYIGQNAQKIGGTYQWYDDQRVIDWIFTLDKLPSDITFPMGRPQAGLYMAHPVNTDHYYPMQTAEETLFMEKVNEFCWLVQCLGATEVSFHSNKGLSVAKGMSTSWNADGEVGVKGVKVGGGYGKSQRQDNTQNSNKQVELVQHFDPKKKAFCPNDLVWLDSDPRWKMLIKQRLEGEIKDYNYKISSSETCQMSTNETNEVKANFEYMMYKVNANYSSSTDKTFSNTEDTEWSIHVEFAPLEELKGISLPNKNISNNEQEYTELVKETIDDGEITPRERKMLERLREKLGISEDRANELEFALKNPSYAPSNATSKTAAMIDCYVNNLSDILLNINFGDNMYPRISEKRQIKLTFKFGMERNEAVLFYRDSGLLFKKYTMAITDKGIYYKDDNKQLHFFMWNDVTDIQYGSKFVEHPEYIDVDFTTLQGEHSIFMTEFGIINKEEADKYLATIVKGLKQMVNTAKKVSGR